MNSYTYTNDPTRVTSVVWYIASESVADYDRETDEPIDHPRNAIRMRHAINRMAELVRAAYPNATTVYIADGGFENQCASMASRCETDDGSIYEPTYDDLTMFEAEAIGSAFATYAEETN